MSLLSVTEAIVCLPIPRPTVRLSRAHLCLDCECIGSGSVFCDCCGSMSLLPLAAVLNRDPEPGRA